MSRFHQLTSYGLWFIGLVSLIFYLPLFFWWFTIAQSWPGRALNFLPLCLCFLALSWSYYLAGQPRPVWRGLNYSALTTFTLALAFVLFSTPPVFVSSTAPLQHRFTTPYQFSRWNITNIVPEIDQMALGMQLFPFVDPLLTRPRAHRLASVTLPLYQEMEQNPTFWQVGSAMSVAYGDVLGLPADRGHYYLYVPQNRPDGPRPVLLFLHGSGGSFKTYLWILSKLAEQDGFIVVAPSYGFGTWQRSDTTRFVKEVLADAQKVAPLNLDQLFVVGLSNGGLGTSHLAVDMADELQGVVYLSPIMNLVDTAEFQEAWRDRPVLVITGTEDERVSVSYVQKRVAIMEAAGVNVTTHYYPAEDHFLFYSQPTAVIQNIHLWLEENRPD